jgi:uncharacterized protein
MKTADSNNLRNHPVHGAGLGLRREIMDELRKAKLPQVGFMEIAPENWINIGGAWGRRLREFTERFDFVCHGLSLSIGSPSPLDDDLVKQVAAFLKLHGIKKYTEHLTYCSDDGHLYDLLPIPFTEQAANYVAQRIQRVQDIIGERIGMENASYYTPAPGTEMQEIDFINTVLEKADCDLLIDINNIYVNSVNHGYDPVEFIRQLPAERICYAHIAGHYNEAHDLIVDTHGADVIENVWSLLDKAYELFGVFPTLLERDFNFPPLQELLGEVERINDCQNRWSGAHTSAHG